MAHNTKLFKTFKFADLSLPARHHALLASVAPRPIALAASMDRDGNLNLSPFSFFNAFGANPAYIAISPSNSGRDGSFKHTYLNIKETGEFTVSIVTYEMRHQQNLASCAYAKGVNEFVKAGFNPHPSKFIKVPGVRESPCILECKLSQIITLGGKPGSGNLIIGEVLALQVDESVLDDKGRVEPTLIDQVARMGKNWYTRAQPGMFELAKPEFNGIGFDALPDWLLNNSFLTKNHLAQLAGCKEIPSLQSAEAHTKFDEERASNLAISHLDKGQVEEAWHVLLDYQRNLS